MEYDELKSRSEWKQDLSYLLIWILIRCWTSTIRFTMDSSSNLVPERSSACASANSSGSFEEPRTTRGDSKRARTGKSSSNGEVSTESVLLGSFFAFHFNTARRTKVCAMQISPWCTHGLCLKFERRSTCGHWPLLWNTLMFCDTPSLKLGFPHLFTLVFSSKVSNNSYFYSL